MIKIDISCQVTVIFQMRGVIKFTDVNWFIMVRIFFEVKTDTVVVQVAQKLTVVQVLDAFLFNHMVYQTSFSKEVVVWEQHFAISLGKIHNSNVSDDKNNDNNVFSQLSNTKVDKSSIRY